MDAVMYLKEKERMTKSCEITCANCLLGSHKNGEGMYCRSLERNKPEKAVEIVDRWSIENQLKTYKQDFLEKFPNAPRSDDGVPAVCIDDLYGEGVGIKDCEFKFDGCTECWNRPMPEVAE